MRLFVAAVPPQRAVDHLASAVGTVRDDELRWSDVDAWHVTLAFYGEVPESKLDDVAARVSRAAKRHPPADLRLAGAGRFGRAVLWIGVAGDVSALRRCAQSMRAVGRRIGVEPEQARFRPHITLARSRRPVDLRTYVDRLSSYTGPEWTVSEVALIRSVLDTGTGRGPRYEVMQRFALIGVTAPRRPPR